MVSRPQIVRVAACIVILVVAVSILRADDPPTRWTLGLLQQGDWFDPAHWSDGLPDGARKALLDNGGTILLGTDGATANGLTVGESGFGTVIQQGGALHLDDIDQDDYFSAGHLHLGLLPGVNGVYRLEAGTLAVQSRLTLGYEGGAGRFEQYGGMADAEDVFAFPDAGSSVVVTIRGGEFQTNRFKLEGEGEIRFEQTGASTVRINDLYLSGIAEGAATGVLDGGTLYLRDRLFIGEEGHGEFTQQSGEVNNRGGLFLGFNPESRSVYNLHDGLLRSEFAHLGYAGQAGFNQFGGEYVVADRLLLSSGDGDGTYTMTGGSLTAPTEYIGGSINGTGQGVGRMVQSGGVNTAGTAILGYEGDSVGIYELSGPAVLEAGSLVVGRRSEGTLTQTDATVTADVLRIAHLGSSDGTYVMTGGELTVNGQTLVGQYGTALFENVGGVHVSLQELILGLNASATGRYTISGEAELTTPSLTIGHSGTGVFTQSGGEVDVTFASIGRKGRLNYEAGVFSVGSRFDSRGPIDFASQPHSLLWDGHIVDFSGGGRVMNAANTTLILGPRALMIVDPSFDPHERFGFFYNHGVLHTAGTTMIVPEGRGFVGSGDIVDPVECSGEIVPTPGHTLNFLAGLTVHAGGDVNLGALLNVDNETSGMDGGRLQAAEVRIGGGQAGRFAQSGGAMTVDDVVYVGHTDPGHYAMTGGSAEMNSLLVGVVDEGRLTLGADADIRVNEALYFGWKARVEAETGATITLTDGAAVDNESEDPQAMQGLAHTRLVFRRHAEPYTFEVASKDRGGMTSAAEDNLALGEMVLSPVIDFTNVSLVDAFDNHPDDDVAEALYVNRIVLESNSIVLLNDINLYVGEVDWGGGFLAENGEGRWYFTTARGDFNGDGAMNGLDIAGFKEALADVESWSATHRRHADAFGDFNGDGVFNGLDLPGFKNGLHGAAPAVPEPATLLLTVAAVAGLFRRRAPRDTV